MDMIERVARALAWHDYEKYHAKYSLLDKTRENLWVEPEYFERARAAIAAMREPTPRMADVAVEGMDLTGAWRAMIDAALGDT